MKKFFYKLFGIIRVCQFCRKDYYKSDAKYIRGKKSNVNFYRSQDGGVKVSTNRPRYECCKDCHKKHREEEDIRYGITPEMREKAKEFQKQVRKAIQSIRKSN